jgi:hypothetical protein
MIIGKFLVYYKQLPQPIKLSSIVYLSCLLGYNLFGTYNDSKIYLDKYRKGELEKKDLKSDWDAVKYGANYNFLERLFESLIWPVTTINNIIPAIVLALNPPKKDD